MIRKSVAVAGILLAALALSGCGGGAAGGGKPVIAVSILPQSYFVERISGGNFESLTLVGPGQSPHSYEPSPQQMAALAKAKAWLTIDVEFEHALLPKVSELYPSLAIVDSTRGMTFRDLEAHSHEGEGPADEGHEAEGHEAEGHEAEASGTEAHDEDEHDEHEGGSDPHVWLGRGQSKILAGHVRDTLAAADPANADTYAKNYEALVADIDRVFSSLDTKLEKLRGKPVFVFHPAFGYFLDEFGIVQEAVETGGKEPTQKHLAALVEEARAEGVKVLFVQPQFPVAAAQTLATSVGGVVLPLDDLAANWLENLESMAAALEQAAR